MHIPCDTFYRPDSTKDDLPLIPDIECDARDALDRLKSLIDDRNSGNKH